MHAVGRIQADALAVRLTGVLDHFVDVRRTEILARTAKFLHAARVADVGVVDDKMRRLVFFMLGAGVVEIGELIEGELAVALGRAKQMRFSASVRRQISQVAHVLVSGCRRITVAQASSAGHHLQSGVQHSCIHSVCEPLMQVAHFPQFFFDPA